jgi:homoserine O-acetyltransferase
LTTRDQVAAEILLAKHLGIECFELVIGASLGGLRALEWAIMGPEAGITVTRLAAIATTAATSADQIAWAHPQLAAIRLDPGYCDGNYYGQPDNAGPHRGLEIARQIAHTTYRSAAEMDARFGRLPQGGEDVFTDGRFAVQSYLDHHGDKLARRFDANSYLVLTESMLTHDIGRDRGGVEAALASIQARALVVGVDSDRLFPLTQSARIAQGIPACDALATIHTPYGHDGFLIEFPQLAPLIAHFLAQTPVSHPSYA